MPSFDTSTNTARTPFGKNSYLRSTRGLKFESYTFYKDGIPVEVIDGANEKVLQPGTALAKITSGPGAGMVGVFQRGTGAAGAAGVNEQQTVTVTATGGTFTLSFAGDTTAPIPEAATAAAVQAALEELDGIDPGDVAVTGSAGGPFTVEFRGRYAATNVAQMTADGTALTPGGSTAVVATSQAGSAAGVWAGAATDGRGDPANLVGLCDTFLPWQLLERDVEVAAAYECTAVQAWCFEYSAAGARVPLTNATADALRGTKGLDITFK